MNIIGAQIISLLCMFISMAGAFLLPFWCIGPKPHIFMSPRYRTALTQANCLSGGVFLATFFIGLMPEVRRLYEHVLETYQITYSFPVTEFVIFIGFLLALAVEQGALEYKEKSENCLIQHGDSKVEQSPSNTNCESVNTEIFSSGHGHSHHDMATALVGSGGSNMRLGMLLISLGVHSLFEGLALGLQTSSSTLFRLAIGVALHELLMAFALGVSVSRIRLPIVTACKLAFVFSATIPVGQVLGLLIGHYQSNATVAISATLQGLAAGTFIHVTFMEIIPTEFNEKGCRLLKVFSLGLGFMLLLLCSVLMENFNEAHSHWK